MTLESRINRNRYIGNGATTDFPFTFKIWKTDQILVYIGDGTTEEEVSSDCTVTITAYGGTVSFPEAPAYGTIIVIRRNMPYIQEDDYQNGTRFDGEEIEDRFDQDCAERQDLLGSIERAVIPPETSNKTSGQLWNELIQAIEDANDAATKAYQSVSWLKDFLADVPEGDISLNSAVAWGGTDPRTLADHFADSITVNDFGAKGDGSTDDTDAFAVFEDSFCGRFVNLCGSTYVVESIPSKNIYYNGFFKIDSSTIEALNVKVYIKEAELSGSGLLGRAHFISGNKPENFKESKHSIISIGTKNCSSLNQDITCGDVIAIGDGVMTEGHPGYFNIGIGLFALHNVVCDGSTLGTRNTAVGSLSLFGLTTGIGNVGLGRDTGQAITTGIHNVCLGYGAMSGLAPMRLSGKIEVENPLAGSNNVCIGYHSGERLSGESGNNVLIGIQAGERGKLLSRNCFIGRNVFKNIGYEQSINGKKLIIANDNGTYSQSGNVITFNVSGNQAVSGRYIRVTFTSGDIYSQYTNGDPNILYVNTIVDNSSFTVVSPISLTTTGDCTIVEYEQSENFETPLDDNVCIGYEACGNALSGTYNVVLGALAAKLKQNSAIKVINNSNIIGGVSCANAESIESSDVIGFTAGEDAKSLDKTILIGRAAGRIDVELSSSVAIGVYAMMTSGSNNITNSMALGHNAQVTGNNQNQIGNQYTTTYCYGSVQDRSDLRDKADVRDTELGLDFILSLRPVDFKWDYREDYLEIVERKVERLDSDGKTFVDVEIDKIQHEKDGSRKRKRYHHGLIAQEVKAVIDEKGIDFGGYQDHKINGGKDVLTIGYEEFIAPIIKSIQELNARLNALEGA